MDQYGLNSAHLSTNETGSWNTVDWWNSSWLYREGVVVTGNSGAALSGFQVELNVPFVASKMKSDFSDLRFVGSDQVTSLPYWIESYTASSSALVWVKVPTIPASGTTTIYMYYGNPSAVNAGNGTATMEFFDDFSGNSLNTAKWNENAVNQVTSSVSDSLKITNSAANSDAYWLYDGTSTGSQDQAKWTPTQPVCDGVQISL